MEPRHLLSKSKSAEPFGSHGEVSLLAIHAVLVLPTHGDDPQHGADETQNHRHPDSDHSSSTHFHQTRVELTHDFLLSRNTGESPPNAHLDCSTPTKSVK